MIRAVRKPLGMLIVGLALLGFGAHASASNAVITLNDGRQIQGELISQDDETVVLSVATIRTTFRRADIQEVRVLLRPEQEYQQRKQKLSVDDIEGWYNLIFWLNQNRLYDQALTEVNAFLQKHGNTKDNEYVARSTFLKNQIEEQIRARAASVAPPPGQPGAQPQAQPAQPAGPRPDATIQNQLRERRLTDDQINMIRVYELRDPLASKPRVTVAREAIEALITNYRDRPEMPKDRAGFNQLRRAPGYEVLALMFALRARELYPSARVHDDPSSLLDFKRNIHLTYVLNYCGTANCHGGTAGGNLFLFNIDSSSNRTVYTNFFNLYTWMDDKGYMINLDKPEDSYLLQFAMPNDPRNANFLAKFPHPPVRNWAPRIRIADDQLHKNLLEWIRGLGTFRNDYGIDYVPPVATEGVAPAQRTYRPAPPAEAPRPAAPATPAAR